MEISKQKCITPTYGVFLTIFLAGFWGGVFSCKLYNEMIPHTDRVVDQCCCCCVQTAERRPSWRLRIDSGEKTRVSQDIT